MRAVNCSCDSHISNESCDNCVFERERNNSVQIGITVYVLGDTVLTIGDEHIGNSVSRAAQRVRSGRKCEARGELQLGARGRSSGKVNAAVALDVDGNAVVRGRDVAERDEVLPRLNNNHTINTTQPRRALYPGHRALVPRP